MQRYWNVDLTSDDLVSNCSMTRIPAPNAEAAEQVALNRMAVPSMWRVVGIDAV